MPVYPVGIQEERPTDSLPNSNGYRISQEFHNDDNHTGVDLLNGPTPGSSTPGGEVRTIFKGTVVLALPEQSSSNFGNVIMIGHIFPDGVFYSLYAHLENPSSRNVCDSVITGEPIGAVGSTGKSDAPHLHLAIKTKGILGCGYINDNCNSERLAGFSNYASEDPLQFIATRRVVSPAPPFSPSTKFAIGDRVQTTDSVNTRCFPNLNLPETSLGVQPSVSQGTVVGGPVFTDGFWWWEINYDTGPDGWSAENFLELIPPEPEPTFGTIQGIVRLFETSESVAGAQVFLFNDLLDFVAETQSDGNGFYQFTSITPGDYLLLADAPDFLSGAAFLSVVAGQTINQDIDLFDTPQPQ